MKLEYIKNISEIITFQSEKNPNSIAILYKNNKMTYLELEVLTWKVSTYLYNKGVREEDIFALETDNELLILIMMLSLSRIGATIINIPKNTPLSIRKMILNKLNISKVFTNKHINLQEIKKNEDLFIDKTIFCPSPKAPCVLLIGSGTTGKKKIIPIKHSYEISRTKNSYEWLNANSNDVLATFVHLNFQISKRIYLGAFYVGATIALFDKNQLDIQSVYEKYNITILHGTVFHIRKILDKVPSSGKYNLPLLKELFVGGSIVSDSFRREVMAKITPNFSVSYGTNEIGLISKTNLKTLHPKSTVGKILADVKVEIIDSNFNILEKNKIGQIRVKIDDFIDGYIDDEEESKISFNDNWFYPKDLGKITQKGELIHMGRIDEMMIMNGINIYPIEIEEVMKKHKAIDDVCVISFKSKIHQEVPVCAVVLKENYYVSEKQLLSYASTYLGFSSPRKIVILNTIPRNIQGKIIREELKEKIHQKLDTKASKKHKVSKSNVFENLNNISQLITYQAKKRANKIAIYQENYNVTYEQLEFYISNLSKWLLLKEIKLNDIVGAIFKSEYLGFLSMLAIARVGATVFSISKDASLTQKKELIKKLHIKNILTDLDYLSSSINYLKIVPSIFKKEVNYEVNVNLQDLSNTPWILIQGSGSTGNSKLIPITNQQQIVRTKASLEWLENKEEDICCSIVNLDSYSSKALYLQAIASGSSIVFYDNKTDILEFYKKYKVTVFYMVVVQIERVLKNLDKNIKIAMPSLRSLILDGSIVSNQLRQKVRKYITPNILVRYGINELGTVTVSKPPKVYETEDTVGFPIKPLDLEIVDKNDKQLKSGEIGEIRIKSKMLIDGYFNDEQATKSFFRNDWFYPKDLGKMTNEGELIFMGRADDMMIMNGINIYPAEIEKHLLTNSKIEDVVSLPIESKMHTSIPVAVVVLKDNVVSNEKELLSFCNKSLGNRAPKHIVIINKIPRNEDGKLMREVLKKQINEKLEAKNSTPIFRDISSSFSLTKKEFVLNLKEEQLPLNVYLIEQWYDEVLKIETNSRKNTLFINNLINKVLELAPSLFQVINIPVFKVGKLISSTFSHKTKSYKLVVQIETVANINGSIFQIVLNQALIIVLEYLSKAINKKNRELLFTYINSKIILPYKKLSGSGKSTIPILKVASELNIPFMHLGSGVYQLGWGRKAKRMDRSTTGFDSAIGAKLAQNKMLTTNLLKDAGLPCANNSLVNSKKDALIVAERLGFPVVVKPSDQDRGEGITVNVDNEEKLYKAYDIARKSSRIKRVIVEKQVDGVCHRLFIANGKLLYSVKRLPKGVYADGINTIETLINKANEKENQLPVWLKTEYFPKDEKAKDVLMNLGFTFGDIPKKNTFIPLREIETTRDGGVDEDVTKIISYKNVEVATKAAKLFGLHVSGIDIISADISKPFYENGAIINEVNFSPLFGGGEISKKAIPSFFAEFIDGDGRIPITDMTGYMDEAIKLRDVKKLQGKNIQLIKKDRSYLNKMKAAFLDSTIDEVILF